VCVYIHVYLHMYVHTRIYIHAHTHAYIYTRTHTHTQKNTRTHAYTHIQIEKKCSLLDSQMEDWFVISCIYTYCIAIPCSKECLLEWALRRCIILPLFIQSLCSTRAKLFCKNDHFSFCVFLSVLQCVLQCVCVCVCVYIYRKRKRERPELRWRTMSVYMSVYIR